eukprot:12510100-Heterocapsa_arctica.AAC.1
MDGEDSDEDEDGTLARQQATNEYQREYGNFVPAFDIEGETGSHRNFVPSFDIAGETGSHQDFVP